MQELNFSEQHARMRNIVKAIYEEETREIYSELDKALQAIETSEYQAGLISEDALKGLPEIEFFPFTNSSYDSLKAYSRIIAVLRLARDRNHSGASLLLAVYWAAYSWGERAGYANCKKSASELLDNIEWDFSRIVKDRAREDERRRDQLERAEESLKERNDLWKITGCCSKEQYETARQLAEYSKRQKAREERKARWISERE